MLLNSARLTTPSRSRLAPLDARDEVLISNEERLRLVSKDSTPLSAEQERTLTAAIRERICEKENLILGHPAVIAELAAVARARISSGSVFKDILRTNDTVHFLAATETAVRAAIVAHIRGAMTSDDLQSFLAKKGQEVSRHDALRQSRILHSGALRKFRTALAIQVGAATESLKDSERHERAVPTPVLQAMHERVGAIESELAPLVERMVSANTGLLYHILGKLRVGEESKDELISAGYHALLASVREFKPEYGFKFSTYAYTAIRASMMKALAAERNTRTRISLNARCGGEDSAELLALVPDSRAVDPKMLVRERDAERLVLGLLKDVWGELPMQQRQALTLYFGINDGLCRTVQQVGDSLGVKHAVARALLDKALRTCRKLMEDRGGSVLESLDFVAVQGEEVPMQPSEGSQRSQKARNKLRLEEATHQVVEEVVRPEGRVRANVGPTWAHQSSAQKEANSNILAQAASPASISIFEALKGLNQIFDRCQDLQLIASKALFERTQHYYRELERARRSSEGVPATTEETKSAILCLSQVHQLLSKRWPMGHAQEKYGFLLEGEMLAIKGAHSTSQITATLAATEQYLLSLSRR